MVRQESEDQPTQQIFKLSYAGCRRYLPVYLGTYLGTLPTYVYGRLLPVLYAAAAISAYEICKFGRLV